MSDIIWKVIETNIEDFEEEEILVVQYGDNYWVKFGNIINVIAVGVWGFKLVGVGAKKYSKDIYKIIMLFRNIIAEEKLNWKHKDKNNIKLIRSDEI